MTGKGILLVFAISLSQVLFAPGCASGKLTRHIATSNGGDIDSGSIADSSDETPSFDGHVRVSESCEAALYATIDRQLPKNQFVSRMRGNPKDSNKVDVEITLDMGDENYCVKAASATIRDEHNGVCKVLKINIPTVNFDCG